MIKEKHLRAKFVLDALKNTFLDRNHQIGRFSYVILNTCVENCGLSMNDSSTRNRYLKELKREILNCPHHDIKIQALVLLRKWERCYGQYRIFKEDERHPTDEEGTNSKKQIRKKRAPNGSIRKAKTPYQLYMKIKTQMLYGAKKGLHMKKKESSTSR